MPRNGTRTRRSAVGCYRGRPPAAGPPPRSSGWPSSESSSESSSSNASGSSSSSAGSGGSLAVVPIADRSYRLSTQRTPFGPAPETSRSTRTRAPFVTVT
ncbi:MAG: hypothetical protein EXS13_08630 [Planctomycetes bacterium]|nr:hypothetical protein [Planctomycetota bacterium]